MPVKGNRTYRLVSKMVSIFWKIEATGEDFDGYIKTFMAFNRVGKQLSLEREKESETFPVTFKGKPAWKIRLKQSEKKKKKIPPRDFSKITAANKRLSYSEAKLGYHFNIKHDLLFSFQKYKNILDKRHDFITCTLNPLIRRLRTDVYVSTVCPYEAGWI